MNLKEYIEYLTELSKRVENPENVEVIRYKNINIGDIVTNDFHSNIVSYKKENFFIFEYNKGDNKEEYLEISIPFN